MINLFTMQKTILYMLLMIFVLELGSCKKYPDGPVISLRTKCQRITGEYQLEKYIVNSIDSTNSLSHSVYFPQQGSYSTFQYQYKFLKEDLQLIEPYIGGSWELISKKEKLRLFPSYHDSSQVQYYEILKKGDYEILRLTNKEFWLGSSEGGVNREIHLKKTTDDI